MAAFGGLHLLQEDRFWETEQRPNEIAISAIFRLPFLQSKGGKGDVQSPKSVTIAKNSITTQFLRANDQQLNPDLQYIVRTVPKAHEEHRFTDDQAKTCGMDEKMTRIRMERRRRKRAPE
jgi:hypothetical protein